MIKKKKKLLKIETKIFYFLKNQMKKASSLFSTSQLSIETTIKSLEIPTTLPSCVFIIWHGKDFHGCSKLFHTKKGVAQIDKTFKIHASRVKNEFATIQLKSKTIRGAIQHLGEIVSIVPTNIFDGETNDAVFEIPTEIGVFKINCTFDILPEEDITQPSIDIRDPPNVSYYSSLLKRLKPTVFSPEKPSNFWGPDGFHSQIESLVNCRATESAVGELESLNSQLHVIAKDVDFYSNFIQRTVVMLTEGPKYVNLKGEIVNLTDRKDQFKNNPIYSVLAISICNSIQQYMKVKSDITYLEMPLIDICGLMAYLISDPLTDYTGLIHIVSTTCFVSSFLIKNYQGEMETIVNAFKVVEKDALHAILKKFNDTIQQKCTLASRIKMLITKNENLFNNCQVPFKIWEQLRTYIYNAIDYYVSISWISGSVDISFDFQKYIQNFPNADFPFMTSISKVCQDPTKYLQNKNAIKELKIRGDWLYQTLSKINENENEKSKLTEQQLLRLVKDPEEPTFMTDIEYFIQNNIVFDKVIMEVPVIFPTLPQS